MRPILDDTLGELDEGDREAVLLRFFARRPFAEIGRALGASEKVVSNVLRDLCEDGLLSYPRTRRRKAGPDALYGLPFRSGGAWRVREPE